MFDGPFDTKNANFGDVPKPISWLGMKKLNLTQQKIKSNIHQLKEMYDNTN